MSPSNIDFLASEESPIGLICLRRRRLLADPDTVLTEMTLDHQFLMSSDNPASERALARCALDWHSGKDLRVLIGGLGLGYTAREALDPPRVARVEVVEYLKPVITWLEQGLFPLSDELVADPRLVVVQGDVYARLVGPGEPCYDLVLVDVDHSPDERLHEANGHFYTAEGLAQAKRHLAPGGILGVWSYAESPGFAEVLRSVFAEVRVEPVRFDCRVTGDEETNWIFLARDRREGG